jgi:hypothetical protein
MATYIRYLSWIAGAGAVLCWGIGLASGSGDWIRGAVGLSLVTVVLLIAFAFRARFSALQGLGAGIILVIVIVLALLVFAAGMAGLGSIR